MKKGFTIMELVTVVTIIGVIAAFVLPQLNFAAEKSKAGEGIILLEALRKSQWNHYYENGAYANNVNNLDVQIKMPTEHFDQVVVNNGEPVATIRRTGNLYTITIDSDGTLGCTSGDPTMCPLLGL